MRRKTRSITLLYQLIRFTGFCILVRPSWSVRVILLLAANELLTLHRFDPSLAFVMGGAIAVAFPFFQYIIRREIPCDSMSM